jgi:hypothetical protein
MKVGCLEYDMLELKSLVDLVFLRLLELLGADPDLPDLLDGLYL